MSILLKSPSTCPICTDPLITKHTITRFRLFSEADVQPVVKNEAQGSKDLQN